MTNAWLISNITLIAVKGKAEIIGLDDLKSCWGAWRDFWDHKSPFFQPEPE